MAFPPAPPGIDGTTVINAAWLTAFLAELSSCLVDAGHATITPGMTTAEQVAARGNLATLSARLNMLSDADGNPLGQVLPSSIRNGSALGNLAANGTNLMWSRGETSAPDYWALSGVGAAIARCGVGLTDTNVLTDFDHFAAKLTYGAAPAVLTQYVLAGSANSRLRNGFLGAREFPVDATGNPIQGYSDEGAAAYYLDFCRSDGTNRARIAVTGFGSTAYSEYHPGDADWHPLIAGPLDPAIDYSISRRVESAGSAHFQGACLLLVPLEIKPLWLPEKVVYKTLTYYANNPATGVLNYYTFSRPVAILGAQMQCLTAGGVSAATIDLKVPIAGAYQSMFTTLPTVAVAQLTGAPQACDPAVANYRRRFVRPPLAVAATQQDNSSLQLSYTDDGGGALRDLMVTIHYLEYDVPFNQFRSIGDLSESA